MFQIQAGFHVCKNFLACWRNLILSSLTRQKTKFESSSAVPDFLARDVIQALPLRASVRQPRVVPSPRTKLIFQSFFSFSSFAASFPSTTFMDLQNAGRAAAELPVPSPPHPHRDFWSFTASGIMHYWAESHLTPFSVCCLLARHAAPEVDPAWILASSGKSGTLSHSWSCDFENECRKSNKL